MSVLGLERVEVEVLGTLPRPEERRQVRFVGARDGARITRNTVQYRVLRAFRRAGVDSERQRGALVHGLRHTFATDLANASVNVYELKTLLGHESLATSQRYIDGAGQETRAAAARNPLYDRLTRS